MELHRFFRHIDVYISGVAILLVHDNGHIRLDSYRQPCILRVGGQQVDHIRIDHTYGQHGICDRIDHRLPILIQLRPVLHAIQRVADCLIYVLVG